VVPTVGAGAKNSHEKITIFRGTLEPIRIGQDANTGYDFVMNKSF
jgi:hypothetical protein